MLYSAQLKYFFEVARCGSIRRAADRLNVASSAISRQILKLEEELDVRLFERHPRGVALTPAGRICSRYALDARHRLQRVHSELDELRDLRRGHITIFSIEGMIFDVLSQAIALFQAEYGGVTFNVTVIGTDQVMQGVLEGEADIGVAFHADPDPDISFACRIGDPVCAVMAPSFPLSDRRILSLREIMEHPVAVPANTFGIRHLINAECKVQGIHLRPALVTNSIEALRGFARLGSGITFLPRLAIQRELELTLASVPVEERSMGEATVDVCVLANRQLPVPAAAFLGFLNRRIEEMGLDTVQK
jgi:DNA-binding transcriptional LysR family regulator